VTLMVGEFPELQGVMGRYYAEGDGEPAEISAAIEEHYWPRFAGDRLPQGKVGIAVSIADKVDTIAGYLLYRPETIRRKDPFALRRLALGILRIILEQFA